MCRLMLVVLMEPKCIPCSMVLMVPLYLISFAPLIKEGAPELPPISEAYTFQMKMEATSHLC
jgi:hypothetical protein